MRKYPAVQEQLTWIAGFLWRVADDVLRDLFSSGDYRKVVLPMTVLRRLDAVLVDTKEAVLKLKQTLDEAGIVEQDGPLRAAAGRAFYNTSAFTMSDLRAVGSAQQLRADFEAYLDGFSPNVQDIIDNFKFRNQIPTLSDADALGGLIEKFTSPDINLSPEPVLADDGSIRHPGLDNHGMGTVFEELVRRFNEETNEKAGEHWTPRDAVKLMANLIFRPVADRIESGTYLLYDGACGTGGMLTVAEETLQKLAADRGKQVSTHLYGQEINPETYAICKADLLLKGQGEEADNIVGGAKHSTLSADAFPDKQFDFMLSNPPYGKSWKTDLDRMGGKKEEVHDRRFRVEHDGDPEYSMVTRVSDGQMLFLANLVSKMKTSTDLGSRIAEVHNGSSLFTGDASSGASKIRRYIIENDWLEAIVALPLNMFYNTDIATYIWLLTNRKEERRCGNVQLIDATKWFRPLRKSLGKKTCELTEDGIDRLCAVFSAFQETTHSKIRPNKEFGYWQVTVDRPLRLAVDLSSDVRARFREICRETQEEPLADAVDQAATKLGSIRCLDFNRFTDAVASAVAVAGVRMTAKRRKSLRAIATRDPEAEPVIRVTHRAHRCDTVPLRGRFPTTTKHRASVVEYEPDSTLQDTKQIPLLEHGGLEAFLRREVLPYAPDAWYNDSEVTVGYEISFQRYFSSLAPTRPLADICREIVTTRATSTQLLRHILHPSALDAPRRNPARDSPLTASLPPNQPPTPSSPLPAARLSDSAAPRPLAQQANPRTTSASPAR